MFWYKIHKTLQIWAPSLRNMFLTTNDECNKCYLLTFYKNRAQSHEIFFMSQDFKKVYIILKQNVKI